MCCWAARTTSPSTGNRLTNYCRCSLRRPSWPGKAGSSSAAPSPTWPAPGYGSFSTSAAVCPPPRTLTRPPRRIQPDAAVIYVDNDEIVLSHAQSLLARAPSVLAVAGDLRFPNEIIYDWRIRQLLSFHQPICLVLTMTLHFFSASTAQAITSQLIDCLPDGSYLIVSVGHLDGQAGEQFTAQYNPGTCITTRAKISPGSSMGSRSSSQASPRPAPGALQGQSPGATRRGRIWAAVGHKISPAAQETT